METRANFALMGAIVILAVIAFAGFTLWLGQSQFNRDFDTYEIVFEGPVTLEQGAGVRFNGISVGEVTRVAIDRSNDRMVRTTIRVNSETPVRTDSVAAIDFAGITGLTFIQIRAGSQNAPLLVRRPGGPLPVIKSELNPLSEIFAGGAKVLETANDSLQNIGQVLSDENVSAFSGVLENLDTITGSFASEEQLSADITLTLKSIQRASDDFAEASRTFTEFGQNADGAITSLATDINTLLVDVRGTVENVNTLLASANGAVDSAGDILDGPAAAAVEEVRLASQDLRLLIQRLDGVARELEQNPQFIVTGDPKPYEGGRR